MSSDRRDEPGGDRRSDRGVSRRSLLGALAAGGGAAGVATAAGTAFSDLEGVGATLRAGAVDLRVDREVLEGPDAGERGGEGAVELPIEYDDDHRSGAVLFEVGHAPVEANNPADVWLRGGCPEPAGTIGEVATVALSYADCETGEPTGELVSGSMREAFDALAAGIPLDGVPATDERECLHPGEPVCLRLEWDVGGYVGGESATASIEAVGRQCRHVDRSAPPFDPGPACPSGDPCPCCLDVGKLELEAGGPSGIGENRIEPGTYAFTEGTDEYLLRVTDAVDKRDGETVAVAFDLVDGDGRRGPALCRVEVAGGPGDGPGPGVETYEPPAGGPYGNSTATLAADGLLFGRRRSGSGDDPDDYHGVSHVTVAVCAAGGRCD